MLIKINNVYETVNLLCSEVFRKAIYVLDK